MPGSLPYLRALAQSAAKALLIAIPIGLVISLLFLALAYGSLGADRDRLAAQIRAGFADGQLKPDASWLFGNIDLGVHQYNDCLILFQALDDRAPPLQRAVSPLTTPIDTDYPCARLQTLATRGADSPPRFYHQYLHAHTTLARLLVPALGARGTRELYKLLISIFLLVGIAYAMLELVRARRSDANAVWLIFFLVFARMFGLEAFGQSLGHAPADLIFLGFLLFLSRASASGPLSARAVLVASALFGGLTIEFEFLTGGLPLGLAAVLGVLPLALPVDEKLGTTVIGAAAAYLAAAMACLVAKIILVLMVFDPTSLAEAGRQLLFRTGISHAAGRDEPAGWGVFFGRVWAGMDALAPGLHWISAGFLTLAIVAGGWGYRKLRASDHHVDRAWGVALTGSNVIILLWLVMFWQHTAEHAWFMDRLLVWPVASGAALFVLALRRRAPEPA